MNDEQRKEIKDLADSHKFHWIDVMLCKKLTREMLLSKKELKKYRDEYFLRHTVRNPSKLD